MKTLISILISGLAISCNLQSQNNIKSHSQNFKIVFYNVENMFDTLYDSNARINTYYSGGEIDWNSYKYYKKLLNIYKTLRSLSQYESLLLVGLAEVENSNVVEDLIKNTPLCNHNLDYCHFDSPDARGIDVALLYNSDVIKKEFCMKIPVIDTADSTFNTRDILYFRGAIENEPIHVFVTHWTSRYRGVLASVEKRLLCANVLLRNVDSIMNINNNAKVIIMGDFNDEEENESMVELLNELDGKMRMISSIPYFGNAQGSLKYGALWYKFDHILLSEYFFSVRKSIFKSDSMAYIYDPDFLLENDPKHLGKKPFRSNIGFKYHGGFSDHLPVYTTLSIIKK